MDNPIAYEGKEPYIFVSYAHLDSEIVIPIISALQAKGFRVWYDSGIEPGTEWPEYIAEHLNDCTCFVAFMSNNAAASHNCRREINFAIELRKEPLVVYLEEDVKKTLGMRMQLHTVQAMYFTRHKSMASFVQEIARSQMLAPCRKRVVENAAANLRDFTIEDNVLKEYRGNDHDVIIPDGVEVIGPDTFAHCKSMISVSIPYSVKEIADGAFQDCTVLRQIDIPEGVQSIGKGTFFGCVAMERITIADSVKTIGSLALAACESLIEVILPNGITELEHGILKGCRRLEKVHIPESVTRIGMDAFAICESLKQIQIPHGVTKIAWGAFSHCEQLRSITIPNGIKEIGRTTFYKCIRLERIDLPEGLERIEEEAFEGCAELKEIVFPDSLTEIGACSFKFCTSLKDVRIPPNIQWMGDNVFYGCESLEKVSIPKEVGVLKRIALLQKVKNN